MSAAASAMPVESTHPRREAVITEIVSPQPGRRRAHTRFAVDLDVSIGSDHNFYAGFAENLSCGGIFVATHLIKPVGSTIELSIHLPNAEATVRGIGQVRWIREFNESSNVPPGMGIRFIELEPGSEHAIVSFLCERDPLFFDDD